MLKYSVIDYETFKAEFDTLRQMNYLEVSAKRGDGYGPNDELYMACGEHLRIVVARTEEREPVGYHIGLVQDNVHDAQAQIAVSDMFYLHPDHRKGLAGVELLKVAMLDFADFAPGVKWRTSIPIDGDRDIGVVLERMGFAPTERVYEMVLPAEL